MATNRNNRQKSPMVTSLSVTFKKASELPEDIQEAKTIHRTNLKSLIDTYMKDVAKGEAKGIGSAKELVEVIKADLLLMGEATDITQTDSQIEQMRIQKLTQELDEDNPDVKSMIEGIFRSLNGANDDYGDGTDPIMSDELLNEED